MLEEQARSAPEAHALYAPGRKPLSYAALRDHVVRTAAAMRRHGIRRDDTVAIVLPNGPEMATIFLSASVAAVCAPLNPSYKADELEFYLSDLPAKALVIAGLPDSPARDVARRAEIPVIELAWSQDDGAGLFTIEDSPPGEADHSLERPLDDVVRPRLTARPVVRRRDGEGVLPVLFGLLLAARIGEAGRSQRERCHGCDSNC